MISEAGLFGGLFFLSSSMMYFNSSSIDYEPHANAVFDVRWLASGASFLTASGDQSIRLVDAERGISLQQFFGHTMSVRCLSLMPSDTRKYPT